MPAEADFRTPNKALSKIQRLLMIGDLVNLKKSTTSLIVEINHRRINFQAISTLRFPSPTAVHSLPAAATNSILWPIWNLDQSSQRQFGRFPGLSYRPLRRLDITSQANRCLCLAKAGIKVGLRYTGGVPMISGVFTVRKISEGLRYRNFYVLLIRDFCGDSCLLQDLFILAETRFWTQYLIGNNFHLIMFNQRWRLSVSIKPQSVSLLQSQREKVL